MDVGVLAVGAADEDGLAEVGLQGVHFLHLVADLAVAQPTQQALLVVGHGLLAGSALFRLALEVAQVAGWFDEAGHYDVAVRLRRLYGDLQRALPLLQVGDDLLHNHQHIDWQIRMRVFLVLVRVEGRELIADVLIEREEERVALQRDWPGDGDVAQGLGGEEEQVEQKLGDGQLAPLEVLRIEDGIEGDLIDQCLEQQRKHCLHVLQLELDQFGPVLVEESVDSSQVLEEGDDAFELILSALLLAAGRVGDVGEQDVADGLAEDAGIPDLEVAFVRLAEALLVDVVPAAAELQERSVCLQDSGEDVLVAEVGQQIRVACAAVLADYAFLHSSLLLSPIGLKHLFLLLLHLG